MKYIWENSNWPNFTYEESAVEKALKEYSLQKTETDTVFSLIDPNVRKMIHADALTSDAVSSSAIEGVTLSYDSVYSSVAKALDIQFIGAVNKVDKNALSLASLVLDALNGASMPIDEKRIFFWHNLLFTGLGLKFRPKNVGSYRDKPIYIMNVRGNMQQDVLFQGLAVDKIKEAMDELFSWVNKTDNGKAIVKSAITSLWFVTIHPFEDGNGRISRALADLIISSDWQGPRTFSISSAILHRKNEYYEELYKAQHSPSMDITGYVVWYIEMVTTAMKTASDSCKEKIRLSQFMLGLDPSEYNSREISMLYKLSSGIFYGKLTADKYTKMMKCTSATSTRDLTHLTSKGMLVKSEEGGRTTWYRLNPEVKVSS